MARICQRFDCAEPRRRGYDNGLIARNYIPCQQSKATQNIVSKAIVLLVLKKIAGTEYNSALSCCKKIYLLTVLTKQGTAKHVIKSNCIVNTEKDSGHGIQFRAIML